MDVQDVDSRITKQLWAERTGPEPPVQPLLGAKLTCKVEQVAEGWSR